MGGARLGTQRACDRCGDRAGRSGTVQVGRYSALHANGSYDIDVDGNGEAWQGQDRPQGGVVSWRRGALAHVCLLLGEVAARTARVSRGILLTVPRIALYTYRGSVRSKVGTSRGV